VKETTAATEERSRARRAARPIAAAATALAGFVTLAAFGGLAGVGGSLSASAHEYQYGIEDVTARVTSIQPICRDFRADAAAELAEVLYVVRSDGKIGGVRPSSIRYWTQVRAPAASFTIEVAQTTTHGSFALLFDLSSTDQIRLHEGSCADSTLPQSKGIAGDQATVGVSGATPGAVYYLSVRYGIQPFLSKQAPNPTTVHYDFRTKVDGVVVDGDPNGLDLKKQ
jgi:hypothetical protein